MRVLLVHWKPEEAGPQVSTLRRGGHEVLVLAPRGMGELRALRADPPDVVVVDLGLRPSQGCAVAVALRQQKATRGVPLVFARGDPEKTARVKALLPDAVYARPSDVPAAVRRAVRTGGARAGRPGPVVPGTMAGYSGTPLPKKLGLKPGSRVALLGAPRGFASATLGPLPDGTSLRSDTRRPFDVGLLFARSRKDLARRFPGAVRAMGERSALWIVWPKLSSALAGDLGGNEVRAFGLGRGLVDYKIAAIDATWSGLCFARRRKAR